MELLERFKLTVSAPYLTNIKNEQILLNRNLRKNTELANVTLIFEKKDKTFDNARDIRADNAKTNY